MSYSELARLSAVDYFSGETLIDCFVQPTDKIVDWRTRYSGVTAKILGEARASGKIFNGPIEARDALLEHIDGDTVLIGHSLHYDLEMLRMDHGRILDLHLLLQELTIPNAGGLGLKTLTKAFVGKAVQNHGKKGHDSLEDTLATRECVIWCMKDLPELQAWTERKRAEEREKKRQARVRSTINAATQKLQGLAKSGWTWHWEEGSSWRRRHGYSPYAERGRNAV